MSWSEGNFKAVVETSSDGKMCAKMALDKIDLSLKRTGTYAYVRISLTPLRIQTMSPQMNDLVNRGRLNPSKQLRKPNINF